MKYIDTVLGNWKKAGINTVEQAKKELKITYEQLSQRSGVPLSTIYDIFRGVTSSPRIDTMQAIERALGLTKWTDEDKAEGVGKHPTYLSADEWDWLELRSEILEAGGQEYLNSLTDLIQNSTKILKKNK